MIYCSTCYARKIEIHLLRIWLGLLRYILANNISISRIQLFMYRGLDFDFGENEISVCGVTLMQFVSTPGNLKNIPDHCN